MGVSFRTNLKMSDGFFDLSESNKRLIIEQIRRFRPEIVLANAITDRHPDHGRAAQLVSEACFLAGLMKVETSWEGVPQDFYRPKAVYHYIQDYFIEHDFAIDITDFIDDKINSIKAYKTQFYDPTSKEPQTPISGEEFFDFIKGRMMQIGRPIGAKYAEGFTVERTIGVDLLNNLK